MKKRRPSDELIVRNDQWCANWPTSYRLGGSSPPINYRCSAETCNLTRRNKKAEKKTTTTDRSRVNDRSFQGLDHAEGRHAASVHNTIRVQSL